MAKPMMQAIAMPAFAAVEREFEEEDEDCEEDAEEEEEGEATAKVDVALGFEVEDVDCCAKEMVGEEEARMEVMRVLVVGGGVDVSGVGVCAHVSSYLVLPRTMGCVPTQYQARRSWCSRSCSPLQCL